ncbi:MAG: MFS transporter [Pseudomonadota bacterium]
MRTGFYRENAPWLATALLLTFGSSFGQTFFISLFAGGIRAEFGLSDGAWGGIYTLATLASAAVLVQLGRLADSVGLLTLTIGVGLGYLTAIALTALAPTVWLLGLGVFGLRLCGQGMMGHLAMTAIARWFAANRGRAVAVAVLGYPLGEALLPPVAVLVISAVGWRAGWGLAAGMLALLILPAIVLLLARGRRVPRGEGTESGAPGMDGRHWTRRAVLAHWSFWALMPGVLAPAFIGTVVFFHQVHVSEVRGWSLVAMAAGYPVYAGVSVAVSLLTGALVDRYGPVRLLPGYLLPMTVAIAALALEGGVGVWLAVLLGIGVSQGLVVTILGALWPTLYGTRHIGSVKAVAMAAMVVSTAIGPGITGLFIDLGYPLPVQGPAMALWCLAASALFVGLVPRLQRRLPAGNGLGTGAPAAGR